MFPWLNSYRANNVVEPSSTIKTKNAQLLVIIILFFVFKAEVHRFPRYINQEQSSLLSRLMEVVTHISVSWSNLSANHIGDNLLLANHIGDNLLLTNHIVNNLLEEELLNFGFNVGEKMPLILIVLVSYLIFIARKFLLM